MHATKLAGRLVSKQEIEIIATRCLVVGVKVKERPVFINIEIYVVGRYHLFELLLVNLVINCLLKFLVQL